MSGYLCKEIGRVKKWQGPFVSGRVKGISGLLIESKGPDVAVGELCFVYDQRGKKTACEVVGFRDDRVLLMTTGELGDIKAGAEVYPTHQVHRVGVSEALCGRVLDAFGQPIDQGPPLRTQSFVPLHAPPPHPLQRESITTLLPTRIKAIDIFSPLGRGQRIGVFSKAGVGKSTLMGMLAKGSEADINVIALIGERGREVKDFIDAELGPEGLARSIVVVVTSDQPALLRCKGAFVATAIAEYFRDCGKHVLLMMDSVTRFAMALREVAIASYEPLAQSGYPSSVFAQLPRLFERAGTSKSGSITGVYTVLTEENKMMDPVAAQVRSLLDGHLVLSRSLAEANHFPPVDVLQSLSRLMGKITDKEQQKLASKVRTLLHHYQKAEELINIGAYVSGSNRLIDEAIEKEEAIKKFLQQEREEDISFKKSMRLLKRLLKS